MQLTNKPTWNPTLHVIFFSPLYITLTSSQSRQFNKLPEPPVIYQLDEQYQNVFKNSHIHFFCLDREVHYFIYTLILYFVDRYKEPINTKKKSYSVSTIPSLIARKNQQERKIIKKEQCNITTKLNPLKKQVANNNSTKLTFRQQIGHLFNKLNNKDSLQNSTGSNNTTNCKYYWLSPIIKGTHLTLKIIE